MPFGFVVFVIFVANLLNMIDYYTGNGKNIRYNLSEKKDKCVVLLHGYLETLEVWDGFSDLLAKHFTVLTLDLPGHGGSSFVGDDSMRCMAENVYELIDHLKLGSVYIIGHSMGGYVANSLALLHGEIVRGQVLFHSNTFADSEEKRHNREKEITLIREGKLGLICANAVPNTFGPENTERFRHDIDRIVGNCSKHKPEGIIACLRAMISREDTTGLLASSGKSLLSVIGAKDRFIPQDKALALANELNARVCLLENSGHMGFIEERQRSAEALTDWINSIC